MLVEGVGRVAPKPVVITVGAKEWSELATEALRRAEHRGYASGDTKWKKGMRKTARNPYTGEVIEGAAAAILIGMVGEYAVHQWCHGTSGIDLRLHGVPLQIKTRSTTRCEVREKEFLGRVKRKQYVVYVFAETVKDKPGDIAILGWQHGGCRRHTVRESNYGHRNIVIADEELLPMSRLMSFCRARRPQC